MKVWGKIDYNPKNLLCTIQEKHGEIISFKVFIMTISLLIPSLIIISCYLAIYFKVRKIQMALISNEDLTTSKSAGTPSFRTQPHQNAPDRTHIPGAPRYIQKHHKLC